MVLIRIYCFAVFALVEKLKAMRWREGQEVDPEYPYTEGTHMIMNFAYGMSIPVGLILLWLAFRGRVMWLKVWSVGLMSLGIGLLIYENLL